MEAWGFLIASIVDNIVLDLLTLNALPKRNNG